MYVNLGSAISDGLGFHDLRPVHLRCSRHPDIFRLAHSRRTGYLTSEGLGISFWFRIEIQVFPVPDLFHTAHVKGGWVADVAEWILSEKLFNVKDQIVWHRHRRD